MTVGRITKHSSTRVETMPITMRTVLRSATTIESKPEKRTQAIGTQRFFYVDDAKILVYGC